MCVFAITGSRRVYCPNQFMHVCDCNCQVSFIFSPIFHASQWLLQFSLILSTTCSALLQTSGSCSLVGANSHNLHQTWFPCMRLFITDYQWALKPSSNQPAPLSSTHTHWQVTFCPVIPIPVLLFMLSNGSGNRRGMCPLFLY